MLLRYPMLDVAEWHLPGTPGSHRWQSPSGGPDVAGPLLLVGASLVGATSYGSPPIIAAAAHADDRQAVGVLVCEEGRAALQPVAHAVADYVAGWLWELRGTPPSAAQLTAYLMSLVPLVQEKLRVEAANTRQPRTARLGIGIVLATLNGAARAYWLGPLRLLGPASGSLSTPYRPDASGWTSHAGVEGLLQEVTVSEGTPVALAVDPDQWLSAASVADSRRLDEALERVLPTSNVAALVVRPVVPQLTSARDLLRGVTAGHPAFALPPPVSVAPPPVITPPIPPPPAPAPPGPPPTRPPSTYPTLQSPGPRRIGNVSPPPRLLQSRSGLALVMMLVLLLAFGSSAIVFRVLYPNPLEATPSPSSATPMPTPTPGNSEVTTGISNGGSLPTVPPTATPFPTMTGDSIRFPASPKGIPIYTITGRFLDVWKVFKGQPLTSSGETPKSEGDIGWPLENALARDIGGQRLTQRFSRFMLVDHSQDQPAPDPPNDVTFAPLGRWLYAQQYSNKTPGPAAQRSDCLWFAATQHNVCDEFRQYWERHALTAGIIQQDENDPTASTKRAVDVALKLFGQPISEREPFGTGADRIGVQWFENARLEYRPDHPELARDGFISIATLGEQCGELCQP